MCEVKKHITDEELNSYRFLSGEEPSEELLEAIMCEVAAEAKERNERATEQYFNQMKRNIIKSNNIGLRDLRLFNMNNNLRKPELIIIAGPNGSGKTSVTQKFLHHEWCINKAVQI